MFPCACDMSMLPCDLLTCLRTPMLAPFNRVASTSCIWRNTVQFVRLSGWRIISFSCDFIYLAPHPPPYIEGACDLLQQTHGFDLYVIFAIHSLGYIHVYTRDTLPRVASICCGRRAVCTFLFCICQQKHGPLLYVWRVDVVLWIAHLLKCMHASYYRVWHLFAVGSPGHHTGGTFIRVYLVCFLLASSYPFPGCVLRLTHLCTFTHA